ncbi:MAG TPA: hypothetical protein VK157_02675 [Phycisphaerales bacterium]|nr:hypothetical protein [Phycisphaerales bacterium]
MTHGWRDDGRRAGRLAAMAMLAGAVVALGGCWTYRAGERERLSREPARVQPQEWPMRTTGVLEELKRVTPNVIREFVVAPGATLEQVPEPLRAAIEKPDITIVHQGIYGKCLVRVFGEMRYSSNTEMDAALRKQEKTWSGFESNARAMTSRTIGNERARYGQLVSLAIDAYFNEEYAKENVPFRRSSDDARYFVTAGLALRLPPEQKTKPRGVLIHLTALVGNPFETKVMDHLEKAGWVSFDIDTQTNVLPEIPPRNREKIEELTERQTKLITRYSALVGESTSLRARGVGERLPVVVPAQHRGELSAIQREYVSLNKEIEKLSKGSYQFCEGDDPDATARVLASELDNAIAGNAYAVEAIVQYIRRNRRDLDGVPIVVIGFSAGGLATPASVARVRDDVEAAVMVGAGANLLMLSQESSLTDGGVRLLCGEEKLPRAVREDLYVRYLTYSKLDPYHTSQAMMGMPVLLLHGSWDGWVPAKGGELLWERLGRPDRVTLLGGHTLLFYLLPGQSERIAAWLEANVRKPAGDSR